MNFGKTYLYSLFNLTMYFGSYYVAVERAFKYSFRGESDSNSFNFGYVFIVTYRCPFFGMFNVQIF